MKTGTHTKCDSIAKSIEKIENDIVIEVLKTYTKNPNLLTPEIRRIVDQLYVDNPRQQP